MTLIMGIVNVTPDSFSDGGRYLYADAAIAHGLALHAAGAAVLDVGVSRIIAEDGHSKVAGDVADEVREVAGWVSPNPGGVGPMTRAMLLSNVVLAAERAAGLGAGSPA